MRLALYVLFFLIGFTPEGRAFSTSPTALDSLQQLLVTAVQDTQQIRLLNQLSSEYAKNYERLDSSLAIAQRAYDRSLTIDYDLGKAEGAYNLAYAYDLTGKLNAALEYYEKGRQHYTEVGDDEWIATCMRGKGIACYFQGDYGRSLEYYHEAMDFAREKGLLEEEANSMLNLGVIYRIIGNHDKAVALYEQNILLWKKMQDSTALAKVYNNLGVVYTYKDDLENAVRYLDSSVVIYKVLQDSFNLAAVYITLGDAYLEAGGDLLIAREYLEQGYQLMKKYDDKIHQSKVLLYLGQVESRSNRPTRARFYLEEGLRVLEGSELEEIRRDIITELSDVCFQLNQPADAYTYLKRAYDLNEAIKSKDRLKYTEEMEVKYETEKKEREITELNAEKTISELKLSAAKRTSLILVIALIIFALLLLGLYSLYQKIRVQRNIIAENLEEKEKLLEHLKKAQEKILQSEKMASLGQLTAGIAHEINNPNNFISSSAESLQIDIRELLPILTLIGQLGNADDQQKIAEIIQLRDEVDLPLLQNEIQELLAGITEGAERTAEIIRGLKQFSHPGIAEKEQVDVHQSLQTVLRIMHGEYSGLAQIRQQLDPLPPLLLVRNQLNQVFINLISNALDAIREKFGDQTTEGLLEIRAGQQDKEVFISFKDNGAGMDAARQARVFDPFYTTKDVGAGVGLGLSISYGIIEEHQGRITFESEKGIGTEVTIWLPLNPQP